MSKTNFTFLFLTLLLSGCGFFGQEEQGQNVAPIYVGNCGSNSYQNEPCITVEVCTPGSNSCTTIPNVVLDTGSYGLRVFQSLVNVPTSQVTVSGGALAECSPFAQGSSDWGPVAMADVVIGGEKASSVPIQLINANFGQLPSDCTDPDQSPGTSGYNGILGIGTDIPDCGTDCESANRVYFSCVGASCNATTVGLSQQVSNPVGYMPFDNNGVTITFPTVPATGLSTVTGTLLLGVATQTNNTPTSVSVLPTDSLGNFVTEFSGKIYTTSFIDSGSNGLYFPATLPSCGSSGNASGFYCPSGPITLSAIQEGVNGSPAKSVTFQVANAQTELNSSLYVFPNLGGAPTADDPNSFDWGLPFFMGKTIYFGISGKSSNLGSGPFYAY